MNKPQDQKRIVAVHDISGLGKCSMTVALPVANELLPGSNLSEVLRIIISNGIILYALSKAKGAGK